MLIVYEALKRLGYSRIVRNHIRAIFEIFLKFASRLVPDGWVELKISGCRCHFRTFQLELDILGTKNFEIGSVVKKLQLFEVGRIFKSLVFFYKKSKNTNFSLQQNFYGSD